MLHLQTAVQGGLLAFSKEHVEEWLSPCLKLVLIFLPLSATF